MPHSEDENAPHGTSATTEEESLVIPAVAEIDDMFVTPTAATVRHSADEFDAAQMQRTTHFVLGRVIYERFQEDGLVSPVPEFTLDMPSSSRGSGDDVPEIAPPPYNFHPTQIIPGSSEVGVGGGGTAIAGGFASTARRPGGFEPPLFPEMLGKEGNLKGRSQVEISVDEQQLLDRVSLTLVDIAGEVDRRYSTLFDRLFEELRAAGGFSWQNFRNVARQVIRSGAEITWGRIVVLIAFALRIAYRLLQENTPRVLRDLVSQLTQFMFDNNILLWIWQNFGGWTAVLAIVRPNMLSFRDLGYLGLGMMSMLGTFFFLSRYLRR